MVYPYKGTYLGDTVFDTPKEMKCYRDFKVGEIQTATGEVKTFNSVLYIDGKAGESIKETDMISIEGIGKVKPVKVHKLPSLRKGLEMVVLYI